MTITQHLAELAKDGRYRALATARPVETAVAILRHAEARARNAHQASRAAAEAAGAERVFVCHYATLESEADWHRSEIRRSAAGWLSQFGFT